MTDPMHPRDELRLLIDATTGDTNRILRATLERELDLERLAKRLMHELPMCGHFLPSFGPRAGEKCPSYGTHHDAPFEGGDSWRCVHHAQRRHLPHACQIALIEHATSTMKKHRL